MKELMKAMHAVQGEVTGVARNSNNPFHKSKYANLEAVVDTLRPSLQKHGLVVMQAPGAFADGVLTIKTEICHAESGEKVVEHSDMPVAKADPQGIGSAITYGCRYALMAMFVVPPVDDDGEAAMGRPKSFASGKADYAAMEKEIRAMTDPKDLTKWALKNDKRIDALPTKPLPDGSGTYKDHLRDEYDRKMNELKGQANGV